jgi:soluble lytic murein transglycosylase
VQEILKSRARKPRQWLKCMVWASAALCFILPGGTPDSARDLSGSETQIPSALRQWVQIENLETPAALKSLKEGVEEYAKKRYDAVLEILPGEQDANETAVADYILLYRAKANLMSDRYREALESFRLLETQFPDSPLLQDALIGQCQTALKLQDAQGALNVLLNPRLNKNSETLYYEARAHELAGDKEKAVDLYLDYYAGYPKGRFADSAQHNLLALSPSALRGKRSFGFRLQRAENLIKASDSRSARQLLVALGSVTAPDSISSQKRLLLLGEAEYRLGRTTTALTYLRKVKTADPTMHAKAMRLEGFCYRRADKEQALISQRDEALKLHPDSSETEELCYSVATYFDLNYEAEKAWKAYKVLYENFPKGQHAERAAWKVALYHYFEKEYAEAASQFWNYLQTYRNPSSAAAAMYWMGRCYAMLGASENARYLFGRVRAIANESYFGLCAREAEAALAKSGNTESVSVPGVVFNEVIAVCDALHLPDVYLHEPGREAAQSIVRARQLWAAGLPEMAVSELRWASQRFKQDRRSITYIISCIYSNNSDHHRAIANMRGIIPEYANMPIEALPDNIWQLMFPMHHLELVSTQAAKREVDPWLVMGLIRQESAFKENARSSANARGLMQILPSTGSKLARQVRIPRYSSGKLYQAETNIALGTYFLASLIERYQKTELALAAYNAGGTRVDRWLKEFGDVDMPEFVEKIPFSETRGYIKQVLTNQALYGLLAPSTAPGTR